MDNAVTSEEMTNSYQSVLQDELHCMQERLAATTAPGTRRMLLFCIKQIKCDILRENEKTGDCHFT